MRVVCTALVALLAAGCSPVEVDFMGSGSFIVTNKSGDPIKVIYAKTPQASSEIDTSKAIAPNATDTIVTETLLNSNVFPCSGLSLFKIGKPAGGGLEVLYEQDPIDNSKWVIEKKYSGDFGHTDNTFVFQ